MRGRRAWRRRRGLVASAAALVAALVAGCQASAPGGEVSAPASAAVPAPSPSPVAEPALVDISPASGSKGVRPDHPVAVSVVNGRVERVDLTDDAGTTVPGEVDAGTGQWRAARALVGGRSYTVTASATGNDGRPVIRTSSFTTLAAKRTISATLLPGDDWTVGVGMPVIVVFSRAVADRAAAEAAMTVRSTPAVEGAWHWFSRTEVHWRPKEFWPAGTVVDVTAALGSAELAPGTWGKRTVTSHFTIGRSQIMTVDVAAHTLTLARDGKAVRTIPVTTGKAGYLTRNGIKVVMDQQQWVQMDASTVGTDRTSPDYYNLRVQYAMRLTWSGEYLHAAPWSVGSQGRANVSHGCTGMSTANARWLYENVRIGDVVIYTNSKRPLEWGNGYTDWNRSFDSYDTSA